MPYPREEIEATVERYVETRKVIDAGKATWRALAEYFTDDAVFIDPAWGRVEGIEEMKATVFGDAMVGLEEWTLASKNESELTYVVPREKVVVVGGTAQEGAYEPRPDPAVAQQILARARAVVPELARATVVGHRVGLRPARPTVRLEAEQVDDGTVVHCYGHGGAGVTLSWGCADDVAALVDAVPAGT